MGFTYSVSSNPATRPVRLPATTRVDATATAQRLAATSGLPAWVYLEPAHRLWATVDPNGSVHPIDVPTPLEV